MKRTFTSLSVSAVAAAIAVFVYAFSFPLAAWFAHTFFSDEHYTYVQAFYRPATAIAMRCPPYLAILEWEARMIGFGPSSTRVPVVTP